MYIMDQSEELDELPPNAQVVYHALADSAPLTQKDLIAETNMPFLAVRDALERLTEREEIDELVYSHGKLRLYLFNHQEGVEATEERSVTAA